MILLFLSNIFRQVLRALGQGELIGCVAYRKSGAEREPDAEN
jgi:hypothetical protein